jgi:hypothetical protein
MSHARACPTAVRLRKGGVFSLENFTFDDKRDINVCPAGEVLTTIEFITVDRCTLPCAALHRNFVADVSCGSK